MTHESILLPEVESALPSRAAMASPPNRLRVDPATAPGEDPGARGRALLENHLALVDQRLQHLSRRSGLPAHEVEELRAWVLFKLVENDYRVLARWTGRSSFSTYVTVVLTNLVRDYRIHVWGKWRPSVEARRRGHEIVLLERLWRRDGLPLDEVIERLRTEHGVSFSRAELEEIAAQLPPRVKRRWTGEDLLEDIPSQDRTEARLEDSERARTAERVRRVLLPLMQAMPVEDRLLLKLHVRDGLSMSAIAPLLKRTQRELYSSRNRCLRDLRKGLEAAGLSLDRMIGLIGWNKLEFSSGEFWE